MKSKTLFAVSLLVAASMLLAACGGSGAPETSAEPVTLDYNWGTEPPTADPALITDTTSHDLANNLFVGLTRFDPVTHEIMPYLATEWTASADGLTYTFKLRDDIPWVFYNTGTAGIELVYGADGNQRFVNAYDVEYAVKRALDPPTGSTYGYILYSIKNAIPVNSGDEGYTVDDLGVKALDKSTIEFTLEYPAGFFPAIVSMATAYPVPSWTIETGGDKWVAPGTIVTCGAYVMSEWIHGSSLTLKKNPYFPMAEDVQIDEVHGVMIVEDSTAFAMYENGELDTTAAPLGEIDRIKSDPVLSQEYLSAPGTCTYYLAFTLNKNHVNDVRVRKALAMSIDKVAIVENVLKGGQIPAGQFAIPGLIFGAPDHGEVGLPYDPEAARALLQEYLDEKGLTVDDLNLEGMFNTSEGHAKILAAIQQMWVDNLGIKVSLSNQEFKVYLTHLNKETPLEDMPHIWRMGWCADYPDENNWLYEVFHSTEGANRLRRNCVDDVCQEIETDEFDDILKQAQVEQDPAVRKDLYNRAEKMFNEDMAAIIPIYFYTTMAMDKPYLTRYHDSLSGNNFWLWSIDWDAKTAAR